MKTDVEKAYDALTKTLTHTATGWTGSFTTGQLGEVYEDLCVSKDTIQRALWWIRAEELINHARDVNELKGVLQEILREVAR